MKDRGPDALMSMVKNAYHVPSVDKAAGLSNMG
jgi:hypothetical protein